MHGVAFALVQLFLGLFEGGVLLLLVLRRLLRFLDRGLAGFRNLRIESLQDRLSVA